MYKRLRKPISIFIIFCFTLFPQSAYALPQGGVVTEGTGDVTSGYAGDTLNIQQTSPRMIADWDSFDILQQETVTFNQPNTSSIALNRVAGIDPTLILGALNANGRIFIINPNGVLFGAGAKVDTAGLLASTLSLNMTDTDFVNGTGDVFSFTGPGGAVANYGDISINAPGGYVALLGSSVKNFGKIAAIEAYVGKVILAAGEQMTVNLDPNGIISAAVTIAKGTNRNDDGEYAAVNNVGEIHADGGKVILTAKVLDSIFTNAVNNDGIIEAGTVSERDGQVLLKSNEDIELNGTIMASGAIDAYADGNIILGNPTEDQTVTSYSWKYLRDERSYKFKEFGYYYDNGATPDERFILSQGNDIGKDGISLTYGGGIDFADGTPQGLYTRFHTGTELLPFFYQDSDLNPGDRQHVEITGTEYGWEDLLAPNNQSEPDFNDAVIDFRSVERTAKEQPALLNAPNIFLTANQGSITQVSGDIQGNNLMLETNTGMSGNGANGGLATEVNNLSAFNKISGNIAVDNSGSLTIADLSSVEGLNSGVTGFNGISNEAPGGEEEGQVDIRVQGYEGGAALNVFAPVESYGPVTFWADGSIIHNGDGDVTIHNIYEIPPPIILSSSHLVDFLYFNEEPLNRMVEVTWKLGETEPGYEFTATAGNFYTMGIGSEIQTNGGNVAITANKDISLALINAKNGSVNISSNGGAILDADLGVAPEDYDVIAHNIKLSEPYGGASPAEIDIGFPFDFSHLWDNEDSTTPDFLAGEPYGIDPIDPVEGAGDWVFRTISEPLANGSWWFHVRTVEGNGTLVRASEAAHIGPFIFDSTIPPPEVVWEQIEKELRVYYEILSPSQFLSFEPARYIGLYAYHPLTPTDSSAFDEIRLDAGAYEFIENNINLNRPLGPYFGGSSAE